MERIRNWSARRSGGRITITGVDAEDGTAIKLPNVDSITVTDGVIVAIDKDRETFILVTAAVQPVAA